MKRREFITLLGSAAAWPLAARAQQPERIRKVGALLGIRENDPEARARVSALRQGLQELGWAEGRNLQIEYRWARTAGDDHLRAADILALAPDLILTSSSAALPIFQRETRTIPIVFVQVPDPVSAGVVASLARPGGNITGFSSYEHTIGSKWLGLLKEAAPSVGQVSVLINPQVPAWAVVFRRMEALVPSLGVQLSAAPVNDASEIERAVDSVVREPNPGLIVLPGPQSAINRAQIITLAAKYRLPTVYPYRYYAVSGGVISYGIDTVYLLRQAASYVDRILRGANPADLPVQAPTKFELVINLQTAKALGFELPPTLLARADEVIE
jgi:putative tryptophan/tyrosine transport system substrate-binding protein